jgi:hypothetical protein
MRYEQPFQVLVIKVYATLIASDGQPQTDFFTIYVRSLNELPNPAQLVAKTTDMAKRLEKLYSAPSLEEDYDGPVMFAEDALAEVLAQVFFHKTDGILAYRTPVIPTSYSNTSTESRSRLMKKIGQQVIAPDISLYASDGKQYDKNYNPIFGYAPMDAEGVTPPYQLPIIENGILKNLLSDASSTIATDTSNGHSRWAIHLSTDRLTPTLSTGVFEMHGTKAVPYKKLKKRLISLAKAAHHEYAYIVKRVSFVFDPIDFPNVFNYYTHAPSATALVVIQVSVKDGSETNISMANMEEITLKNFNQVGGYSIERTIINLMVQPTKTNVTQTKEFGTSAAPCSFMIPKYMILNNVHLKNHP